MKLEMNIEKKHLWIASGLAAVIVLAMAGFFVAAGASPNIGGVWHSLNLVSTDAAGTKSVDDDGNGMIDNADNATAAWRRNGMVFEVYNSDTTTYACVTKNLMEECGDFDGCTIRVLLQSETDANDQVHIIDENIYMEQNQLSSNKGAGRYGWTRQSGGGDFGWIAGSTGKYNIFNPWSWAWAYNYEPAACNKKSPATDTAAHTDPYTFTFETAPTIRGTFIVYD